MSFVTKSRGQTILHTDVNQYATYFGGTTDQAVSRYADDDGAYADSLRQDGTGGVFRAGFGPAVTPSWMLDVTSTSVKLGALAAQAGGMQVDATGKTGFLDSAGSSLTSANWVTISKTSSVNLNTFDVTLDTTATSADQRAARFVGRTGATFDGLLGGIESHVIRKTATTGSATWGAEIALHSAVLSASEQNNVGAYIYNSSAGWLTNAVSTSTSTGGTGASAVVLSSATWTVNEHTGRYVTMTSGAASGLVRRIASNTSTTLTTTSAFSPAPSSGDTFTVSGGVIGNTGIAVLGAMGWDAYLRCYTIAGTKVFEVTELGEVAAAVRGTFGSISAGSAVLNVKQSANTSVGGFRTVRSDTSAFSAYYTGGDNKTYVQNGTGSAVSLGAATTDAALIVNSIAALSGNLLELSVNGTNQLEVSAGGNLDVLGKLTLGTLTTGTARFEIAQSANTTAGGLRFVPTSPGANWVAFYAGGDNAGYYQTQAGSYIAVGGGTGADALLVNGVSGLTFPVLDLQVNSSTVFSVTAAGLPNWITANSGTGAGGAAATNGNVSASAATGPTTAGATDWIKIQLNGATRWLRAWS